MALLFERERTYHLDIDAEGIRIEGDKWMGIRSDH